MRDSVTTFYEALPQLREERLAALDFDTFVVIDTHWHTTLDFVINGHARNAGVYTSDEIPWMINEYEFDYPGDPALAASIAGEAQKIGVPAQVSAHRGLPMHYGTLNPMHYYNPGPEKKNVVAISVLDTAETAVNLRFGEALARAICASDCNAVVVASGGLSHRFWPLATIRERASADPADISAAYLREWDERIMALWRAGRHAEVIAHADAFRKECAPEGRFAHYLVLAGALGGEQWKTPGIQYGRYEAAIGTGQANFWFPVTRT